MAKPGALKSWLVGGGTVLFILGVGAVVVVPQLKRKGITSNESGVVWALRQYLIAQNGFHRQDRYGIGELVYANSRDGAGFPDLHRIAAQGSGGEVLGLIPREFAEAKLGGPGARPYHGYYFTDIVYDDPSIDCGLCAVPAKYGKTGFRTFLVAVSGKLHQIDTQGVLPTKLVLEELGGSLDAH